MLYHMEAPRAEIVSEVLVDNQVPTVLQAELASCPWPPAHKVYSVKVFLVFKDATESTTL